MVFRGELEQLARRRGARLWFVAGRRADLGGDPLTAAALPARIPGLDRARRVRVRAAGDDGRRDPRAAAAGVHRRHIHHESFEF